MVIRNIGARVVGCRGVCIRDLLLGIGTQTKVEIGDEPEFVTGTAILQVWWLSICDEQNVVQDSYFWIQRVFVRQSDAVLPDPWSILRRSFIGRALLQSNTKGFGNMIVTYDYLHMFHTSHSWLIVNHPGPCCSSMKATLHLLVIKAPPKPNFGDISHTIQNERARKPGNPYPESTRWC